MRLPPLGSGTCRRDVVAWSVRAAAWVVSGSLLSGCGVLGVREQCDNCVPPRTPLLPYHNCCDNFVTKETAHSCAHNDLKQLRKTCGKLSRDFAAGFHQAYEDLALGRYAAVPAVPPSRYWTAYYRSCAGQEAVEDWYAGYRTGLEMGMHSGVSRFNRVASPVGSG